MKDEIYSAQPLPNAIPATEENLQPHLSDETTEELALFTLGNLLLRRGDVKSACETFERALALSRTLNFKGQITVNLARALFISGKLEESKRRLREILFAFPELALGHRLLGEIALELNDLKLALNSFERYRELLPSSAESEYFLGYVAFLEGDKSRAEDHFKNCLRIDPDHEESNLQLTRIEFYQGKSALDQISLVEACEIWSRSYIRSPQVFRHDREISREMKGAIYAYTPTTTSTKNHYQQFLEHYFRLGLLPEVYERELELKNSLQKWRSLNRETVDVPYTRYREALVLTYLNQLEEALSHLRWCADRIPRKKHESIRLAEIIKLVSDLVYQEKISKSRDTSNSSEEDWVKAGFRTIFESTEWKNLKFSPSEAALWRENGFRPADAERWLNSEIPTEIAVEWIKNGFREPTEVKLWSRSQVAPTIASEWRDFLGGDVSKAVQWIKAGFLSPAEALEWTDFFEIAWEAIRWKELGFSPVDVEAWKEAGFREPFLAFEWKKKAGTPAEALKMWVG
jgi:tetratricopeptide (TPR) repeat protein